MRIRLRSVEQQSLTNWISTGSFIKPSYEGIVEDQLVRGEKAKVGKG